MKKKITLSVCIVCAMLLVFVAIVMNSNGVKEYNSEVLQSTIDVPLFAFDFDESRGDDTVQLEFFMFGTESHIVEQLVRLYETNNGDNDGLDAFDFMQWSVNDMKICKHIIIVYQNA